MGDLVDLDEWRTKKKEEDDANKSERELRIEEIITLLESFFDRNPVETGPFHSGYEWLDPDYNPSVVKIVTFKDGELIESDKDEPTD
tara:strand:- start:239 stop:499 length:261 start_codon:yes stop_codon:yes gene_type:complete